MNFKLLKIFSKLISGLFLFFISLLLLAFILISFKPIKINFLDIKMQTEFFENFGIKDVGDIYFSFNKFSKNFELHFENIQTDNSFIPNLLLGIDLKKIIILDFKPSILKIYDANILIDLPKSNEKLELKKIAKNIIKDLSSNKKNTIINDDYFDIIEVNNSKIELNTNIFSKKKISLFPVDFKIIREKGNISISGVIQKLNEKSFASLKLVESEKKIKIESNFDNFQIELPTSYSSNLYFTRNIFNFTGENKIILDKEYNVLELSSDLNFSASLNNKEMKDSFLISNGNININKDENEYLTYFSSKFKSNDANYSIDYSIDLKKNKNQQLSFSIDRASFEDIKKFWPLNYKKSALNWVKNNAQGKISNLDMQLSFPDEIMSMKFNFTDGIIRYSEDMPKVFGLSGRAEFTNKNLFFEFSQGNSNKLKIEKGNFRIFDLDKPVEKALLNIEIKSNSENIVNYLKLAPVNFDKFMRLRKISGKPKFNLELSFPLLLDLKIEDIEYKAKLAFSDSNIKSFFKNYDLESLFLNIDVDSKDVIYHGNAIFEKMPLSFRGKEFLKKGSIESILVDLELKPSFLNNFFNNFITNEQGIIPISMNIENNNSESEINISGQGKLENFYGDVDVLDVLHNYNKGKFDFKVNLIDGTSHVTQFILNTESTDLEFDYYEKNKIRELVIKKIYSPSQDFSGSIIIKDNLSQINIRGEKLDLYHILKNDERNNGDIHFNIDVNTLFLTEVPILSPTLEGKFENNKFEKLLFKFVNNGLIHRLIVDYEDGNKTFNLESKDASFFLDVFDLNPNLKEGYLSIKGTEKDNSFDGKVILNDFIAYDTPLLTKILTFFSLDGLEQKVKDGGIYFNNLSSDYKSREDKIVLSKGLIRGSDLGLTFNGDLNIKTKDFYVEGTLIPAYTLNTLLTKVPIVGDIITAGSPEEGVLAATFNVENKNDEIDISFNPISVLVPSIIRNFLDF
jgi:hypothetical protein